MELSVTITCWLSLFDFTLKVAISGTYLLSWSFCMCIILWLGNSGSAAGVAFRNTALSASAAQWLIKSTDNSWGCLLALLLEGKAAVIDARQRREGRFESISENCNLIYGGYATFFSFFHLRAFGGKEEGQADWYGYSQCLWVGFQMNSVGIEACHCLMSRNRQFLLLYIRQLPARGQVSAIALARDFSFCCYQGEWEIKVSFLFP